MSNEQIVKYLKGMLSDVKLANDFDCCRIKAESKLETLIEILQMDLK